MPEIDQDTAVQGWRSRTVERSLQTARARAVKRGSRYITAAQELLAQTNRPDFTLQEIVDHSRSSMRTFYLHFASKDDLLLAVLEEEIGAFVDMAQKGIKASKSTGSLDKVRIVIETMLSEISSDSPHGRVSRALAIYYMRLFETNPEELSLAIQPLYELVHKIVEAGVVDGDIRTDIEAAKLAELVMRLIVSVAQSQVLGNQTGNPIDANDAWQFCFFGLSKPRA